MNEDRDELQLLLQYVSSYALFQVRHFGRLPPSPFVRTPKGLFSYSTGELEDERDVDTFLDVARLVAIGYSAIAVAMAFEESVAMTRRNRPVDSAEQLLLPSPTRRERVIVTVESSPGMKSVFFAVERNGDGKLITFRREAVPRDESVHGKFPEIMPRGPRTVRNRRLARRVLQRMGVNLEFCG